MTSLSITPSKSSLRLASNKKAYKTLSALGKPSNKLLSKTTYIVVFTAR